MSVIPLPHWRLIGFIFLTHHQGSATWVSGRETDESQTLHASKILLWEEKRGWVCGVGGASCLLIWSWNNIYLPFIIHLYKKRKRKKKHYTPTFLHKHTPTIRRESIVLLSQGAVARQPLFLRWKRPLRENSERQGKLDRGRDVMSVWK